jgi:hypothetical protein
MLNRRQFLATSSTFTLLPSCARAQSGNFVTPEQFGAIGDGKAEDGLALSLMVDNINAMPRETPVRVVCRGQYLLAGTPRREMAPSWKAKEPGSTFGLPPVRKDNVTIEADGAEFIVPDNIPFIRTIRGGAANDIFFVLWQFLGSNCAIRGGRLLGRLSRRTILRGPRPIGFGGLEFALVMEGENWRVEDVVCEEWGTDCMLVTAPGISRNSNYIRSRRNGVSIVAKAKIGPDNPVIIEGGEVRESGNWPADVFNNPACGIVVEAGQFEVEASAIIRGVEFSANRLKDIQLSKYATSCQILNNTLSNDIRLRPYQLGGHVIEGNRFYSGSQILVTDTLPKANPVTIRKNIIVDGENYKLIRHQGSRSPGAVQEQAMLVNELQ